MDDYMDGITNCYILKRYSIIVQSITLLSSSDKTKMILTVFKRGAGR
jgi:hypothetical protein